MSEHRRKMIIDVLMSESDPITGAEIASRFEVSRQVIVQDIAILRAEGWRIIATSNGYIYPSESTKGRILKTIVSKHDGIDRLEEELLIIVEYGGKVIDVIIEHPVYGDIIGNLLIESKEDIKSFMSKFDLTGAKPLSILTNGEHIHTIEVPSEKIFNLIKKELIEKNFIDKNFIEELT